MTDVLMPYGSAILGLMALAAFVLVLGPLVGAKKANTETVPGAEPAQDYSDPGYRIHRAHLNAVENFSVFAVPTLFAMLLGVTPVWVNALVWAMVAARVLYNIVYLRFIGKATQGLRTGVYVVGWLFNVAMVLLVIFAAL